LVFLRKSTPMSPVRLLAMFCAALALSAAVIPASGEPLPVPRWVGLYDLKGKIGLRWVADPSYTTVRVYRAEKSSPDSPAPLAESVNGQYIDETAASGKTYVYFLRGVTAAGMEGPSSAERSYGIVYETRKAVTAPAWEGFLFTGEGVGIKWQRRSEEDILTFNVYRRTLPDGELKLLASTRDASYHDKGIKRDVSYGYVVTALDSFFQEGPPSRELVVAPVKRAPKAPGAKEERWHIGKTKLAGMITKADVPLFRPADIVLSRSGDRAYVSDSGSGRVQIFGRDGSFLGSLLGRGGRPWENLLGLGLDQAGYLYTVDAGPGLINRISPDGTILLSVALGEKLRTLPPGVIDVAPMPGGRVYVVDNRNNRILVLEGDEVKETLGGHGFEAGSFSAPTFCTVDRHGNLYVSDALNSRVQIFDMQGKFVRSFGVRRQGPGGFGRPKGIAVGPKGKIYVADSWQNVIQVFSREGAFLQVLGDEKGGLLDLGSPNGIAIDDSNRLWIVERLSNRVQIREL
jgi:DNA-binding beta-propeller fold protein YncE